MFMKERRSRSDPMQIIILFKISKVLGQNCAKLLLLSKPVPFDIKRLLENQQCL